MGARKPSGSSFAIGVALILAILALAVPLADLAVAWATRWTDLSPELLTLRIVWTWTILQVLMLGLGAVYSARQARERRRAREALLADLEGLGRVMRGEVSKP